MKKIYNTPDLEVICYTLVDVLSLSITEGEDNVLTQYNDDSGELPDYGLGDDL